MATQVPEIRPASGAELAGQIAGRPPRALARPTAGRLAGLLAVAGLIAVALGLRLYGIGFGLPHIGYYWDEPTVVNHAVRFGTGDLNPHWFYYPAFFMYLVFAVIGAYGLLGMATGRFAGLDGFAMQYFVDPSEFFLAARLTSAVIGVLTVLLLAWLGRRWLSPLAGWLAGLFLAVSVLHASQSHIAVTDIALAFFFVAACWPLLRLSETGQWRYYWLAGLLIGLGTATKYFTILVIPSLILAHVLAPGRPPLTPAAWRAWLVYALSPRLLSGLAAVCIGFFIGSPYNVLDYRAFLGDGREQYEVSSAGENSVARFYLINTLPSDIGWPLLVAALIGLPLLVRRLGLRGLLLLSVPAGYLTFMMLFPRGFARYMVPLTPFLALAAGLAVATAFDGVRRWLAARGRPAGLAWAGLTIVVAGLIALPTYANLRWDAMLAHEVDPRTAARDWLQATAPAGTPIAVQSLFGKTYQNAPVLTDRGLEELRGDIPAGGRFGRLREGIVERVSRQGTVYREVPFAYDYEQLRAAGVRYILTTNQSWQGVLDGEAPADAPEARFLRDLQARARVAARFTPATDIRAAVPLSPIMAFPYEPPTITIYEIVN